MLVWTTASSSSSVLAEAGGVPGVQEVAVLTPAVRAVAAQAGEVVTGRARSPARSQAGHLSVGGFGVSEKYP